MQLHEMIDKRYADRGKWAGVKHLCGAKLPYEMKLKNIQEQYLVSRVTAIRWYSFYRAQEGLK
jgi:hypothetical protein